MKKSAIYSQGFRLRRICSESNVFKDRLQDLSDWFVKRGYPKNLVKTQIDRCIQLDREECLKVKDKGPKEIGVPLVVNFNPCLSNLSAVLNKLLPVLYTDREVKKVFTPKPFVSFRSLINLKGNLVRSKVYPLERDMGSRHCGESRCKVCNNIVVTRSFSSSKTGETFKINHKLHCNSKCLIYLLTCKVCGIQYVGQTTDKFRYRWNNYKAEGRKAARGEDLMQKFLHAHFLSEGHSGIEEDGQIILIDKTDSAAPLQRESFWMYKLKTLHPHGLNIEKNH